MGCFCHASTAALALQLPSLDISASLALPGADIAMALSAFLSARGLPAEPWLPDPAWLSLQIPMPKLSIGAIATISAMASLRAQVMAQFGIDLLVPAQLKAFVRIVATLNAHLSASLAIDPTGWAQLANLNAAIDQIQVALNAGLLTPSASLMMSLTMPGGIPIVQWGALLRPLRLLAALIAASLQLNVALHATAEFSAALRVLARINLPALAAPSLVANISAALSAAASLQLSLGVPALKLGLPALSLRVQVKLKALLALLSARFGLNLSAALELPSAAALIAELLALLPKLPVSPGSLATSAVIEMALQAQALAALDWQITVTPPAIPTLTATCNLAVQMQASLGISAVLPGPCGSGCDAAKLMGALSAVV